MTTTMRTVPRRLTAPLIALFVAALVVLVPQTCAACSCAFVDFQKSVDRAGAIFSGTVVERVDPHFGPLVSSSDLIEYTVEVDTVYAGEVPAVTVVQSARESASCGVDLVPGRTYLLLTDPETTDLVGLCGGTAELRLVTADQLAVLGAGSAPAPAPADGDPGAEPAGRELTGEDTGSTSAVGWGLGGVGIAGLLMFAAIWWPRRG